MRKFASGLVKSRVFMCTVFAVLGIFVSHLVNRYIVFGSCVIGSSMYPTLKDGDSVWVSRITDYDRGDIVIVDEGDKYVIKRLIGLPGEVIQIVDSTVYIDGKEYYEPYVDCEGYSSGIAWKPVELGDGDYFILGDNRVISKDSREIGAVREEDIVGVVIYN